MQTKLLHADVNLCHEEPQDPRKKLLMIHGEKPSAFMSRKLGSFNIAMKFKLSQGKRFELLKLRGTDLDCVANVHGYGSIMATQRVNHHVGSFTGSPHHSG